MSLQPHEITLELIYGIQALAIANSYIVVPAVGFTRSQLEIYWEDVAHAGLLDHRFPEDVARDFDEFLDGRMIKPHSYYVVNCDHVEIRAEFELDNFTGKAAQILKREGKRYALSTQCIGGGQGISTILEAA